MRNSYLLPISFIMMYCFSYWQYTVNRNERVLFEEKGVVTHAETKLVTKMVFEDWCQIDFVTQDGQHITDVVKCGGIEGFKNDYNNLDVIYLEGNPNNFQELFEFNKYSHLFTLFFFFGILGFGGTFVLYYFLKNVKKRMRL